MKDMGIREIANRYAKLREARVNEGMDPMGMDMDSGGSQMATPWAAEPAPAGVASQQGGAPGAIMPPPSVVPPMPPSGGIPGAAGDAALSPPPVVADPTVSANNEDPVQLLKVIRENLIKLEIKLKEAGILTSPPPPQG